MCVCVRGGKLAFYFSLDSLACPLPCLLCFALLCFALLCFALLCFALLACLLACLLFCLSVCLGGWLVCLSACFGEAGMAGCEPLWCPRDNREVSWLAGSSNRVEPLGSHLRGPEGSQLWMDEIHFAAPKKPWFLTIAPCKCQETLWFGVVQLGAKWISSTENAQQHALRVPRPAALPGPPPAAPVVSSSPYLSPNEHEESGLTSISDLGSKERPWMGFL